MSLFIFFVFILIILLLIIPSPEEKKIEKEETLEEIIYRIIECLKENTLEAYKDDPSDKFHTDTVLIPLYISG
jgi:hypothetical protein